MVGSRDYFDKNIDGAYNVALADRQPGSSFKPFVYSTAFGMGYTPQTTLFDVPTEFSTNCAPDRTPLPGYSEKDCYHPDNFDNKFKGPISLRSAIAESRNVPSVKLLYLVGVQNAVDTAHKLGITTLQDPKDYGLSLVLGGGEVKLLDMVGAYSVFANEGLRNQPTGILEIRDQAGNIVEQYEQNQTQVMDQNIVDTLNDVLSDAQARAPTFGSSITIPGVAVKTGTTNNDRDAWIIGYTPSIAVGVWSGNNDNKPMKNGGSAVSGPTWKAFMQVALQKYPQSSFQKPIPDPEYQSLKPVLRGDWMGNETVTIDKQTGLRATDSTPPEAREEKVITDVHTILYWVNKLDPKGPTPTNPGNDPEFHLWEPEVQTWWQQNMGNYQIITPDQLPSSTDTSTRPNPSLSISGLPAELKATDRPQLRISDTNSISTLSNVAVYVDSIYITTLTSPFSFTLAPDAYGLTSGVHTLTLQGTNTVFGKSTLTQNFTITQ